MTSVLQHWVMELPLREQGTMLASIRGCDTTPKPRTAGLGPIERHLTAYLRGTFMVPADPRELTYGGAFMRLDPPVHNAWKASEMGHLPEHYYAHLMHAFQVVAMRHPDSSHRGAALAIYVKMVRNLHLNPETSEQFELRLSEDRVAAGTVVS